MRVTCTGCCPRTERSVERYFEAHQHELGSGEESRGGQTIKWETRVTSLQENIFAVMNGSCKHKNVSVLENTTCSLQCKRGKRCSCSWWMRGQRGYKHQEWSPCFESTHTVLCGGLWWGHPPRRDVAKNKERGRYADSRNLHGVGAGARGCGLPPSLLRKWQVLE